MFNFIKRLFGSKDEIAEEKIDVANLSKWLDNKTKPILDGLNEDIKVEYVKVRESIENLKLAIEGLQNAEAKDDNIQQRIKQVVIGNRDNYVRSLNSFLFKLNVPEKINYRAASAYCANSENELNNFAQSSAKGHFASQHLFFDQVEEIKNSLNGCSQSLKGLKGVIAKRQIDEIEVIRAMISEMESRIKKKEEIKKEINAQNKLIKESEDEKEQIDKKIAELKKSDLFKELSKFKEDEKALNEKIKQLEDDFVNSFTLLDTALRKYAHMLPNIDEQLEAYIAYPIATLKSDADLRIVGILQELKKAVEADKIDLKDKRKDKAMEKLNEFTADYFKSFLSNYSSLLDKKESLEKNIRDNKVEFEIKEFDYKKEHLNEKVNKTNEFVSELKKAMEKITIDDLKEKIKDKLKHFTPNKVELHEAEIKEENK